MRKGVIGAYLYLLWAHERVPFPGRQGLRTGIGLKVHFPLVFRQGVLRLAGVRKPFSTEVLVNGKDAFVHGDRAVGITEDVSGLEPPRRERREKGAEGEVHGSAACAPIMGYVYVPVKGDQKVRWRMQYSSNSSDQVSRQAWASKPSGRISPG